MPTSDILPIYINDNLLNNLFTVVVQEFKEKYTIKNRSQQVMKISTPLGNVLKGKYIQGDFGIDVLNEYSRERTQEWLSAIIEIFLETQEILAKKNQLKSIESVYDIVNIGENDYVEFGCVLNKCPQIKNLENLINYLQMKQVTGYGKINNSGLISLLQNYLNQYKNSQCVKYVTEPMFGTDTRIIVPMQTKYMQDDMEFLNGINVNIMGKVLKVFESSSDCKDVLSNTYYDYLNEENFKEFKETYLKDCNLNNTCPQKIIEDDCKIIEILPLGMYI